MPTDLPSAVTNPFDFGDWVAFVALIVSLVAVRLASNQWVEDQRDRILSKLTDELSAIRVTQQRLDVVIRACEQDALGVKALTQSGAQNLQRMRHRFGGLADGLIVLHEQIVGFRGPRLGAKLREARHRLGLDAAEWRVIHLQADEAIAFVDQLRGQYGLVPFIK